ncbi:MAG TPA: hypothetical protein VNU70_03125 [Puia sp.]|jgi:hypothetical protein|nr:hypothetical protein [Puia sp.]
MAKNDKKTIDMPDVSDIPGQEHVRPPRLGELADTTASSADEEDELEDDEYGDEGLEDSGEREDGTEDDVLSEAALDDVDDDGDPLNEGEDVSGDDLDIPGADEDDSDEAIGEEDEENNDYSLSENDEEHDDLERDALD